MIYQQEFSIHSNHISLIDTQVLTQYGTNLCSKDKLVQFQIMLQIIDYQLNNFMHIDLSFNAYSVVRISNINRVSY